MGINARSVADNWRIVPSDRKEYVGLRQKLADSKTSSQYAGPVQWRARRRPVSFQQAMLLGLGDLATTLIEFHLFLLDGQTYQPQELDVIVDAQSVTWQIERVQDMFFAQQWRCYCQQNLG